MAVVGIFLTLLVLAGCSATSSEDYDLRAYQEGLEEMNIDSSDEYVPIWGYFLASEGGGLSFEEGGGFSEIFGTVTCSAYVVGPEAQEVTVSTDKSILLQERSRERNFIGPSVALTREWERFSETPYFEFTLNIPLPSEAVETIKMEEDESGSIRPDKIDLAYHTFSELNGTTLLFEVSTGSKKHHFGYTIRVTDTYLNELKSGKTEDLTNERFELLRVGTD